MQRIDHRADDELRPIAFEPDFAPHAHGSVLVSFGQTRVICSAMLEAGVPRWMMQQNVSGGWLTAEYSMLPYSTLDRKVRDVARGKLDGRSSEIQRLIGRSLRAVVDLKALGQRTLWIDCDVLQADGGTRTASISGACVAVEMAFRRFQTAGKLKKAPLRELAAAVSAGIWRDDCRLDLNYHEDKDADVDFNFVMTESGDLIEMQGSGEEATFTRDQMMRLLEISEKGVQEIVAAQKSILSEFDPGANLDLLSRLK
ncbi:MAG: ribonuclease PH [Verrucomicrobiota bacterium]